MWTNDKIENPQLLIRYCQRLSPINRAFVELERLSVFVGIHDMFLADNRQLCALIRR